MYLRGEVKSKRNKMVKMHKERGGTASAHIS